MTKLTRRQFASTTAALTVAASTRHAYSQSPNEQLGVCIAGLNGRGGEHIRGFIHDPRTEIRAVVDIDEEVGRKKAELVADKQGRAPEVFKDAEDFRAHCTSSPRLRTSAFGSKSARFR